MTCITRSTHQVKLKPHWYHVAGVWTSRDLVVVRVLLPTRTSTHVIVLFIPGQASPEHQVRDVDVNSYLSWLTFHSCSGVDESPQPQPEEHIEESPQPQPEEHIEESLQPQPEEHINESSQLQPDEHIDEPSPPQTIIPAPDVSWSPSPSILALPTPNASAISLWTPSSIATDPRDWPELFVDASGSGIGLILNKRWLAWTFTPNHPLIPLGRNNSVVSSWSELIAVELGLLTLLAAGYRDTTIKLKSDNIGVVKAIKKRRWSPNHELDIILQRVLSISEDNGLRLKVGWVLGVRNPADKPSRGRYPPREMMLEHCPEVPHYFAGMIQNVDRSSLRQ